MKKYLLGLFLVTLSVIYFIPIIATAVVDDPNDAFGNVEIAQPVEDQTISPTDKLSVVWNMANSKLSKLIAKKRDVFFRVTLVQEPTCADTTSCPPLKYELTNGKKYTRATDFSYSYDAVLPADLSGRYRVAVCYQVYAGQRLSKILARTRCGASAVFNFATSNAGGDLAPDSSSYYDPSLSQDYYYDQSQAEDYDYGQEITPVNGNCGSANGGVSTSSPSTNLCLAGTTSLVEKINNNWAWSCLGLDGGVTTNCSMSIPNTLTAGTGVNSATMSEVISYNGKVIYDNNSITSDFTVMAGDNITDIVTVKNTSQNTWTSTKFDSGICAGTTNLRCGAYRLANASGDGKNPWANFVSGPFLLPGGQIVPPGNGVTFTLELKIPTIPGVYSMQWKMVQDGIGWFNSPSLLHRVTVVAKTASPREAGSQLANVLSALQRFWSNLKGLF